MQSEATYGGNGLASWNTLVANLSCLDATSPIECVRAAPATTIQSAIEHLEIIFPPVADNVTNSKNVATQLDAGTFAHVPFMIGTTSQEGRFFEYGQTNITAYLEMTFPRLTALQAAIAAQYPSSEPGYFVLGDILTNLGFLCPTATLSSIAASKGYDVWRYYYNESFPNSTPFPNAGVYHGSDVPEVFGTYNRTGATAQQVALSRYMQTAWANMAKHDTPGWPKLGTAVDSLADLGGNGSYGELHIDPSSVDFKCSVYAPVIAYVGL